MENSPISRITAACVGAAFTVLTACATSAPTRFYVLSSLPASGAESRNAKLEECTAVGVGPVKLPDYLDRTEIVTRVSPNKLELAQFDQWAESLESNFSLVLAENLSALLCTDPIVVFPWSGSTKVNYHVELTVLRFDGELGGEMNLSARWSIFGEEGDKALVSRKSVFTEPTGSSNYEALAAAGSRALENLSREIADAIKGLLQGAQGN